MEQPPPAPDAPDESPLRRPRWVVVVVVFLLVVPALVAVVAYTRGNGASTSSSDVHVVSAGAPHTGRLPPQFSGTTVDGARFALAAEHGRVVMVNFFATWCSNCKAELPLLERTYAQRHDQGLDIVSVDFNDGGDARAFLRSYGVTFPALLDPSSDVGHAYLVSDLPVTFFVGRDGRLASVFHGQLSEQTLGASLQGLL